MDQPRLLSGNSIFTISTWVLCTQIDFDEADLTAFMSVSSLRLLVREYLLSTDEQKHRCRSDFSQPWQWLCHHKLVGPQAPGAARHKHAKSKQKKTHQKPPAAAPEKHDEEKMEGIEDLKQQWREEVKQKRRERKLLQRANKREAKGLSTEEEDFMEEVFIRRRLARGDGSEAHARRHLASDDRIAWEQAELDARVMYRLLVEVELPGHPMHGKYVRMGEEDGLARQERVAECLWMIWSFVIDRVEHCDSGWVEVLGLEKVMNAPEAREVAAPVDAEQRLRLAKDRALRAERWSRRWNTEEENADLETADMLKASLSGMQM